MRPNTAASPAPQPGSPNHMHHEHARTYHDNRNFRDRRAVSAPAASTYNINTWGEDIDAAIHGAALDAEPVVTWQTMDAAAPDSFNPSGGSSNQRGLRYTAPPPPPVGSHAGVIFVPGTTLTRASDDDDDDDDDDDEGSATNCSQNANSGAAREENDHRGRGHHDLHVAASPHDGVKTRDSDQEESATAANDASMTTPTMLTTTVSFGTCATVVTADKPRMPTPRNQRHSSASSTVKAATPNNSLQRSRQGGGRGALSGSLPSPGRNRSAPTNATTQNTTSTSSAEAWVEGGLFLGARRRQATATVARTRETATAQRQRGIFGNRRSKSTGSVGRGGGRFVGADGADAGRHSFLHASCTTADRQFLRQMYART